MSLRFAAGVPGNAPLYVDGARLYGERARLRAGDCVRAGGVRLCANCLPLYANGVRAYADGDDAYGAVSNFRRKRCGPAPPPDFCDCEIPEIAQRRRFRHRGDGKQGSDMSEGGTSLVVMVQIDGVTDHRLQPDTLDRSVPTQFSPPGDHWRLAGTEHPQSEAEMAAQGWRYDALAAPF